jgi:chaperonin cofactor prefoldin
VLSPVFFFEKNQQILINLYFSTLKRSTTTTTTTTTTLQKKSMSKIMLTTTEEEEEEEESKPLLLRGERATTTTRRNHPKAFFALLFLVVVVSSALFAVHFSSSSLSSSDRHRLGVGIPHGEEETTKLGEVNDVSTDAKAQEEEEDKDAAPKPENHEEKEVAETEDEEKVEKLIAKENELSEEVKTEMTDWKGEVEEQHKEIVDAVQILTTIDDDDDVAKATGSVDDAVAKVHKAQALIKDAVAAPPKIEKESEEIDGITQEIEEEIDNTDSTPSSSSTVTPEEAEAKMEALREHISTKQAEITKACDDISAAKAAMLDGSLAKEEGLKQIIANAEIISTSEASVYEEFHAVTKETESAPKGQTEAPSSPSDTDNN